MEKGIEIRIKDCKIGERYCLDSEFYFKHSFIIIKMNNSGILVEYGDGVEGLFNKNDSMIVFTNPYTELEKALL